uniref:AAA+ ATPase domain-containing protein n=1 Tax=Ditylenchus dipsaci TaxID=166011 RepID=A0A915DBJ0_9BILA
MQLSLVETTLWLDILKLRMIDLCALSEEEVLRFFVGQRLLKNKMNCDKCGKTMRINKRAKLIDRIWWSCKQNRKQCTNKSIRSGSFFANSHLKFSQLLLLLYVWAKNYSNMQATYETGITGLRLKPCCAQESTTAVSMRRKAFLLTLEETMLWAKRLGSRRVPAEPRASKKRPDISAKKEVPRDAKKDESLQEWINRVNAMVQKEMKNAGPNNMPPTPDKNKIFKLMALSVLLLVPLLLVGAANPPLQAWSDFHTRLLQSGQIMKIIMLPNERALIVTTDGVRHPIYVSDPEKLARDIKAAESYLPPERWVLIESMPSSALFAAFFVAILALSIYMLFKSKPISFKLDFSSAFKNHVKIYDPKTAENKLNLKFRDVAGLHEAKVEVKEFVDYLKKPLKYTKLGAKLPKGALLTGPPGCGKTLLAKALAAESSVPFISINGTEFVEMIGGMGASRVRDLFKKAKSMAPCIIYIDEIDAVGRKRNEQFSSGEEEQTLNQLLVEMDGMNSNEGIVVIGSTNRADILDRALLRPGRFDRHISVDLPTVVERKELFDMYLRKIKLDNNLLNFSQRLAQMTPSFSGADIRNIANEAAIHAATNKKSIVSREDLNYALDKINAGPEKRSKVLVKEEREIVAYHESGHALVGWLLEHTDALLKVTIIPRTSAALGFAQYSPRDRKLFTKEELFDRMCMMLGGRAAENVTFNRITTGARNDLERNAYAQIRNYGMNDKVGPLSFTPSPGTEEIANFTKKPYSKKFQSVMDQEVNKLVSKAYFVTESLLKANKDKLEIVAKELLSRETLSYEDVKNLIEPLVNTVHWQWRDLICETENGSGPDKISEKPAECSIALREAERDTQRRTAEKNAGCFDEVVNGTTRSYFYLIKRTPQVHRSCFVFFTHRLERRGENWYLWRHKDCRQSQITFTIRCEFLFPRTHFPKDQEVFSKLKRRI